MGLLRATRGNRAGGFEEREEAIAPEEESKKRSDFGEEPEFSRFAEPLVYPVFEREVRAPGHS